MSPALWYHRIGAAYVSAQIYFHLSQVGVVRYLLQQGRCSSSHIAEALNLEPKVLEDILHFVANVDVIIEKDQRNLYSFSAFGKTVIERFNRVENGETHFNFFDVRVGAYGPIWASLTDVLKKKSQIGVEIKRDGAFAEKGLYKLSSRFLDGLKPLLKQLAPQTIVEFGSNTGIIERIYQPNTVRKLIAIDRSAESNKSAEKRMADLYSAAGQIEWITADLLMQDQWHHRIPKDRKICFFSVHLHELVAQGEQKFAQMLSGLHKNFAGHDLVVLEQPHPRVADREHWTEELWLSAQALALVHHISNSGVILDVTQWTSRLESAGMKFRDSFETGYLGFKALHFEI
jgi:hypothetical protein